MNATRYRSRIEAIRLELQEIARWGSNLYEAEAWLERYAPSSPVAHLEPGEIVFVYQRGEPVELRTRCLLIPRVAAVVYEQGKIWVEHPALLEYEPRGGKRLPKAFRRELCESCGVPVEFGTCKFGCWPIERSESLEAR